MKRAKSAGRKPAAAGVTTIAAKAEQNVVTVPVAPPRNPYVSLAHQRKAGVHGESGRTRRQAEKRELRAKLLEE
ncbi:MAG: hypothetical protein ABI854_02405 [Betaproteobacteria bacterium]